MAHSNVILETGSQRLYKVFYQRADKLLLTSDEKCSSCIPGIFLDTVGCGLSQMPPYWNRWLTPSCVSQIWLMALCVTCVFAVTLSVFPVITVRVKTVYVNNAEWGETSLQHYYRSIWLAIWLQSRLCVKHKFLWWSNQVKEKEKPSGHWKTFCKNSSLTHEFFLIVHPLLSLPNRQSVHLCLLFHCFQCHGLGRPYNPIYRPVGESAAWVQTFLFLR